MLAIELALRDRLGGDIAAQICRAAEITLVGATAPTEADYEAAAVAADAALRAGWAGRCAAGDAGRDEMYRRRGIY